MCDFEGRNEDIMVTHILEKHTTLDKDSKLPCDECNLRFETKDNLRYHYIKEHTENTESKEDPVKLKEQHKQLKRLEPLFQVSLAEVNQVKSSKVTSTVVSALYVV